MATVAQLQEEALQLSSLNRSDTAEQALALRFLNEAYERAVGMSGASSTSVEVGPAAGSETIVRSEYEPTEAPVTVRSVLLAGTLGSGRALQRRAVQDVIRLRATEGVQPYDGPLAFAVRGNGDIELWPAATGDNTLVVEMDVSPPELVASGATSGQEETPSAILPLFHRSLLLNFAVARLLQYRGLEGRGQFFMAEHERAMTELAGWLNEQGGIMGPPIRVRREREVMPIRYPDQRP